jgi:coenzyme F420-0:L-glutamate ligase/coenzyme F420-1:gamma-L-glutamate ligase
MSEVRVIGLEGIPEIHAGDDLPAIIVAAARAGGASIEAGDVLVVTQKVVSKAEGRIVDLDTVTPSPFAHRYAEMFEKDARQIEVVLGETKRIVRMQHGVMICETHHGFICANAGVDASNVEKTGTLCLLPIDSNVSARQIRVAVRSALGVEVAVVVSDTFGRPWREGHVNFAIGIAGIRAVIDYAGQHDPAAAELVHGKLARVPVAIVRGVEYERSDDATTAELIRPAEKDMFR